MAGEGNVVVIALRFRTITRTDLVSYAGCIGFSSATEFAVIAVVTVDEWCGTCIAVVWFRHRTGHRTHVGIAIYLILGTIACSLVL